MDEDDHAVHDVFSSSQLWKQSSLFADAEAYDSALFAPLQLDISSIKFDHPYAPKHELSRELRLPDLDTFEFGPLPELDSIDESSLSIDTLHIEPDEDLWQVAFELGPANKDVLFHTWEGFEDREHREIRTSYLTERRPEAYDAALAQDDSKTRAGRVVRGEVFLQSLWNLGLGRSSILFQFNAKLKSFEPTVADGRPSGVSLRAAQSLVAQFTHTGNTFLYLRAFSERTFASAASIPARVALATAVTSVLSTLEAQLGKQSGQIASLIQLQNYFSKPREMLLHIARLVDATRHAKTNEQLSSIIHHRLLELQDGDQDIKRLSSQILCEVAKPSLELLGEWIGTVREQETVPVASRGSFVAVESGTSDGEPIEYTYRSEMMPRFIAPDDGNTIFDSGNSLRFLKTQHPNHPLVNLSKCGIETPKFEWAFGWRDIEAIAVRAKKYENALRETLLSYSRGARTEAVTLTQTEGVTLDDEKRAVDLERYFDDSMRQLDAQPQQPLQSLPDEIQLLLTDALEAGHEHIQTTHDFSPPLSLISSLSFRPLITAQAKMVNAATLRLFFRSHHLRHHIAMQRQYHLLGDGVFSSLLATALFDPDRESAERHKGKMRSGVHMGLQLGSRSSWPPASSELRLALRGVLSESYYSSSMYYSFSQAGGDTRTNAAVSGRDNDELPGQLNFAIRNLTELEQEKVMDPDALSALDFLRLQYVPPAPLNLIITTSALDKYDVVFKFLLRLLRMLFVVDHLPRRYSDLASRQFRTEAHHFVTMFADYVFQTGITKHWEEFDGFVSTLEKRINEEDSVGEYGTRVVEGIASLRDAQEKCLDSIMFCLFLRKRQRKIVALVDEIFEHILLFAKMQHAHAAEVESVKSLYDKLRGKIRVFLSVCRSLTGKKGYGSATGNSEENSMERLVLGLEMNGYFAA
ncbi:Spc98 family-domain-containing protein [Paraphoma chrysanthemicola]|uniref:Spindle pole body component n=1 Tax=Paraphoma chrysanthemicola TaxID=798071 RepID=A0A8K0R2L0_9PLEO|nr:Spc98 family-domain-containing protein [Paraphoma chrysanthemicola]